VTVAVSEDVEVLGPEPMGLLTVGGTPERPPTPPEADLGLVGELPDTWAFVCPQPLAALAALGLPEAPAEALEALRVEAGLPRLGKDVTTDSLVQEGGLERVAVSFEKGCYLGQETVARAQYRGRVNRRLRGLLLPAPAAEGAGVSSDGRPAGAVTTAVVSPSRGPIALAMLHRSVEPGSRVAVDGIEAPARVVDLPFPAPGG
jgi:folate-binding protein YgfZ